MYDLGSPKLKIGGAALVGLVVGVFIGMNLEGSLKHDSSSGGPEAPSLAQAPAADYASLFKKLDNAALWTPYAVNWQSTKPPYGVIGRAPLTVYTPAVPYDYAAMSRVLTPTEIPGDTIIRVDVTGVTHEPGLSLVNPQGSPLVTQEKFLSGSDNDHSIFFMIRTKDLPAGILVRNGAGTQPGTVTIKNVYYTPASKLTPDQVEAVNRIGLQQPATP